MVSKKPNLLDAFQASAPEGRKALTRQEPPATAAGPFAGAGPSARVGARGGFWARVLADRVVQFAVVLCLVGLGIAYLLSRPPGASVDAARGGPEAANGGTILREQTGGSPEAADPIEANRKAASLSASAHDAAFLDPRYKFTVRVAQFANDEAGRKAALENRDYLRAEGLPVVQPVVKGPWLILCVGYKEKLDEIETIRDFVRALPGPAGAKASRKPPYADAWVDNINHVAARK